MTRLTIPLNLTALLNLLALLTPATAIPTPIPYTTTLTTTTTSTTANLIPPAILARDDHDDVTTTTKTITSLVHSGIQTVTLIKSEGSTLHDAAAYDYGSSAGDGYGSDNGYGSDSGGTGSMTIVPVVGLHTGDEYRGDYGAGAGARAAEGHCTLKPSTTSTLDTIGQILSTDAAAMTPTTDTYHPTNTDATVFTSLPTTTSTTPATATSTEAAPAWSHNPTLNPALPLHIYPPFTPASPGNCTLYLPIASGNHCQDIIFLYEHFYHLNTQLQNGEACASMLKAGELLCVEAGEFGWEMPEVGDVDRGDIEGGMDGGDTEITTEVATVTGTVTVGTTTAKAVDIGGGGGGGFITTSAATDVATTPAGTAIDVAPVATAVAGGTTVMTTMTSSPSVVLR